MALALSHDALASSTNTHSWVSFDFSAPNTGHSFDPNDFNIVGIYDFDWLVTSEFERMLDLIASSPGAIGGVRSFGIFTMGERELLKPGTGGVVWTDPSQAPDFSLPFEALEALTTRGLTPFISLGFFPPAVSHSPIVPPANFDRWKELVRAFFSELLADDRFGAEAIKTWSFEVWNEPNEGRFWSGTFDQYLDLYQATSEVVTELDLGIRLGGPAMAYKPESETEDGPETMSPFLTFLRDDPSIQCDFLSCHRKGTVDSSQPNPRRLFDTAIEISDLVEKLVPERAADLALINNEADEKIGFEAPYLPRMDRFAASWLTTLVTIHSGLTANTGRRFSAVQDNANLQLMQTPFDGRRSIYSFLSPDDRSNLIKTCGAVWYDLLPMLDGTVVTTVSPEALFPNTELHAIATTSKRGIALLATWHPVNEPTISTLNAQISMIGVPWEFVNIAEWKIDSTLSNAYAAAGTLGKTNGDAFTAADAVVLRGHQELSLSATAKHGVEVRESTLVASVAFAPYDTVCVWITPANTSPIAGPKNVVVRSLLGGIKITWSPVEYEQLLGYEIATDGIIIVETIRPCTWVDSIALTDQRFSVRAISASGITSEWVDAVVETG